MNDNRSITNGIALMSAIRHNDFEAVYELVWYGYNISFNDLKHALRAATMRHTIQQDCYDIVVLLDRITRRREALEM